MGKMWCMHTCTFAGILWIIILPARPSRCLCSQHSRCGCPSILIPAAVVALSLSFFPPPAPRRSASSSLAASLPRAPPSTFFAASNRSVLRASPAPASPVDSTAAHPFLLLRPPRFSSPAFSTASTFLSPRRRCPAKKRTASARAAQANRQKALHLSQLVRQLFRQLFYNLRISTLMCVLPSES